MTASLETMVHDHQLIEKRAALFKADLMLMGRADAWRAAYELNELSTLINEHLAQEGKLVAAAREKYGQTLAWRHIERKHNEIRTYWSAFVEEWNLVSISQRWAEFRLRARQMFSSIQNLVCVEIDRVYLPALRIGLLTEV